MHQYIITEEEKQAVINALGEIPIKYTNALVCVQFMQALKPLEETKNQEETPKQ